MVFSYDMPRHINTYIHRIGRTGRAGHKGTSVTLLTSDEQKKFEVKLNFKMIFRAICVPTKLRAYGFCVTFF